MFKFKVGDEVLVTSGRDKGKKGKIQKVLIKENKLVVGGVNLYKRHKKATRNQKAGIFDVTRPVTTASVAIICSKCGKPTKIEFKVNANTKERICKKCGGTIIAERNKK